MKFILTRLRYGINKVFYKQRGVLPQARRVDYNRGTRSQNDFDSTAEVNRIYGRFLTSASPLTGLNGMSAEATLAFTKPFQTRGLLDLVTADKYSIEKPEGDFANINPENFAHALNYSRIDIEFANFRLDEIQTTISQALDNISNIDETGNLFDSGTIDSNRTITSNTTHSHIESIPIEEVARESLVNQGKEIIFRPML